MAAVLTFVIGEDLFSLLDDDVGDPVVWVVLVSATPALLVFVTPGVLAVVQGRKAIRFGRPGMRELRYRFHAKEGQGALIARDRGYDHGRSGRVGPE